jgi:hypothetical protein
MDIVRAHSTEIDAVLAAALRGEPAGWPADWVSEGAAGAVVERIAYHGVATLLNDRTTMIENWPTAIREQIPKTALAQSMWELRHALVVGALLEKLTNAGVPHLLLKGSAIAYDLYQNPAARERGDTDLLVPKDKRDAARETLNESGFRRDIEAHDLPEAVRSQEPWSFTSEDATIHSIDLHWQPLNTPALDARLSFDEMASGCRALPRLSAAAIAPSRLMMLLHACLHRGLHDCSPYFVGGRTYFGGNRLIWLYDLALLGRAMSASEWRDFCRTAVEKRVAAVCLEGLAAAESCFGAFCPDSVREKLRSAKPGSYFRSGQFGRALQDLTAVPGVQRKWQYLWARAVPTRDFVRAKYPEMEASPLAALYLRRFVELLRERPGRTG